MATTNKEIIANYKLLNNIPLEAPLYTYGVWKTKGRQVKKGEVCRHKLTMWKHSNKTVKDKEGNEKPSSYCFTKTMYLFEASQTEEIVK